MTSSISRGLLRSQSCLSFCSVILFLVICYVVIVIMLINNDKKESYLAGRHSNTFFDFDEIFIFLA